MFQIFNIGNGRRKKLLSNRNETVSSNRMMRPSAACLLCVCFILTPSRLDAYTGLFKSTRQCPPGPWWDVTWSNIPNIRNRDLLRDINTVDANMDDNVTLDEMMVLSNWGFDVSPPISRCEFVRMQIYRYGVYHHVASLLYDIYDVNDDNQLTESDFKAIYSKNLINMDSNGDNRLSVCELYRGYVDYIREADDIYLRRKVMAREIVAKADEEVFAHRVR